MPTQNGEIRSERGRFGSGNPGKPKGSKHKKTLEIIPIKEMAQAVLLGANPQTYIQNLRHRILAGDAPHAERFFLEHLWGKPKDTLQVTGLTVNFFKVYYDASDEAAGDDSPINVTPRVEHPDPSQLPSPELPAPVSEGHAAGDETRHARVAPPQW